jgi:membrane-associated phospholipid phosphatase
VDLATRSNPAGLLRVDAMLGTTYFRDLYTRGATVFGALPSLHAAYPFFGLLATFRRAGPASRAIQIAYAFWMAFAAVYLNHHWLIDVLLGIVYAGIAAFVVGRLLPEASERARK